MANALMPLAYAPRAGSVTHVRASGAQEIAAATAIVFRVSATVIKATMDLIAQIFATQVLYLKSHSAKWHMPAMRISLRLPVFEVLQP
jgi:hypothetical protein